MANRRMLHGATASRVAANIRELRRERGLDLAALSDLLARRGHAVGINTLSKMERGTRRVDVDDLMALALALDVTPNRLLLSKTADDEILALPGNARVSTASAWAWAAGDSPLPPDHNAMDETSELDLDRAAQFFRENRPHHPPAATFADLRGHELQLAAVTDAVTQAEKVGVSWPAVRDWLDLRDTLQRARGAVDEAAHRDDKKDEDDDGKH
jgi:transcriptional regulator with XRE-family HTH domain